MMLACAGRRRCCAVGSRRASGFAALALLGAPQWQRMIEGLPPGATRQLAGWVADRWPPAPRCLGGLAQRWRARGGDAHSTSPLCAAGGTTAHLGSSRTARAAQPRRSRRHGATRRPIATAPRRSRAEMLYSGPARRPSETLQLLGAALCVCAALLAFWPRARAGAGTPFRRAATRSSRWRCRSIAGRAPVASLGGPRRSRSGRAHRADCRLPVARAAAAALTAGRSPRCSRSPSRGRCRSRRGRRRGAVVRLQGVRRAARAGRPARVHLGARVYGEHVAARGRRGAARPATTRPSYWKMRNLDEFDAGVGRLGGARAGGSDRARPARRGPWQAWRGLARDAARDAPTDRDARRASTAGRRSRGSRTRRASTGPRPGELAAGRPVRPLPRRRLLHGAGATPLGRARSSCRLPASARTAGARPLTSPDRCGRPAASRRGAPGARSSTVEVRFPPFAPAAARSPVRLRSQTLVRSHDGDRALRDWR